MSEVVTIGLDIAKSVFQLHGVDAAGEVVVRRQLKRGQMLKFFGDLPSALIGIEACGTAHHWGRQLANLGPPSEADPARLCEAVCEAPAK